MRPILPKPHSVSIKGFLLLFILTLFILPASLAQETRADYLEGIRNNENIDDYVYSLTRLSELYRFKKPDSARLLIQEALEVSERENFIEGIIRAYNALGNLEVAQNNNTVALQHLKKVLAYEDKVKQKIFFGTTYNALGLIMAEFTDYQKAIQYYQKAYDILKTYEPDKHHENVLANIAIMHFELLNFEKGFEYMERVLKFKRETRDTPGELQVLATMATANANRENYKQARKYIDAKKDNLVKELEKLMKSENIHRDPKISIEELASRLNTNRTYLSKIINSLFNCNFKTFINRHRISEARHLLINPEYRNYTIEAIAEEVGFASKSAFNFVFKKETGLTPSIFQKNALKTRQPEPVLS